MEDDDLERSAFYTAERKEIRKFLSGKDLNVDSYRQYLANNHKIDEHISSIMCWPSMFHNHAGVPVSILEHMIYNGKLEIIRHFLNHLTKEGQHIFPRGNYILLIAIGLYCDRRTTYLNVGVKVLDYIKKALQEKTISFSDGITGEHVNAALSGLKGGPESLPALPLSTLVTELGLTFTPVLYQSFASMKYYIRLGDDKKHTQRNDSFFIPDEFQLNVDDSISDENLTYVMRYFSNYFATYIRAQQYSLEAGALLDDRASKILKLAVQLVALMQSENFLGWLENNKPGCFTLEYLTLYRRLLHVTLFIKGNGQGNYAVAIQSVLNSMQQTDKRIIELCSCRAKGINEYIKYKGFALLLDALSYQARLKLPSESIETFKQSAKYIETYEAHLNCLIVKTTAHRTSYIVHIQKYYEGILTAIKNTDVDMSVTVKLDLMYSMIQRSITVKSYPKNCDNTYLIALLNCLQQTILSHGNKVTTGQIEKNKAKIEKIIIGIMSSFLSCSSFRPNNWIDIVEQQQRVLDQLLIQKNIIDISVDVMESAVRFLKGGIIARERARPPSMLMGQANHSVIKIPHDLKVKVIIFIFRLFSSFIGADKSNLFKKEKSIIWLLFHCFDKKYLGDIGILEAASKAAHRLIIEYPVVLHETIKKRNNNSPIILFVDNCAPEDRCNLLCTLSDFFLAVEFETSKKLLQDLYKALVKKHFPSIEDMRDTVEHGSTALDDIKYEKLKSLFAIFSEYYKTDYIKKHSEEIADAIYQKHVEYESYDPLTEFALHRVNGVKNSFKKMIQRALQQFYQDDPSRLGVIGEDFFKEGLLAHISELFEPDRFTQNNICNAAEQTYREIRKQPPRKRIKTDKTRIHSGVITGGVIDSSMNTREEGYTPNSCFRFFLPGCSISPISNEDDDHHLKGKEKSGDTSGDTGETPFMRAFHKRHPDSGYGENDAQEEQDMGEEGDSDHEEDGSRAAKRQKT